MKHFLTVTVLLLFISACKKEKPSATEILTGTNYKDWQRTRAQQGAAPAYTLDNCATDDTWRFFSDGRLQVSLNGTNCGGTGITGPVLYAHWLFNQTEDSIIWSEDNTNYFWQFRIFKMEESEFILENTDSAGLIKSYFNRI